MTRKKELMVIGALLVVVLSSFVIMVLFVLPPSGIDRANLQLSSIDVLNFVKQDARVQAFLVSHSDYQTTVQWEEPLDTWFVMFEGTVNSNSELVLLQRIDILIVQVLDSPNPWIIHVTESSRTLIGSTKSMEQSIVNTALELEVVKLFFAQASSTVQVLAAREASFPITHQTRRPIRLSRSPMTCHPSLS